MNVIEIKKVEKMSIKKITGGATAAKGFQASGVVANIKSKNPDKKDVALIFSETPAHAAAVFTTNVVKAAPVLISEKKFATGKIQALVINSGNANACTGEQGMQDAKTMCEVTAKTLQLHIDTIAVASTGVIGVPLPMIKVIAGIENAAKELSSQGAHNAALAIMTTDTFSKEIAVQIEIDDVVITIGGMSKGSGMIHPNMATTLGFLTTDANISLAALQLALKKAIHKSFNMITVDGDTSTNDMVAIMANGFARNSLIENDSPNFDIFYAALEYVLIYLAKEVVRDGEGATKLFEMQVHGAATIEDARKAALSVCNSALVKTAIFGQDANWGRILCALGYSGANFDPTKVDLYLGDVPMMLQGTCLAFDEDAAAKVLAQKEIIIKANLNSGHHNATAWGCDLSYDYVKINGSYRT